MGTWGAGLYQNDIGEDIKLIYQDQLRHGKTSTAITAELSAIYEEALTFPDDAASFWFALADIQWDYGRLLPDVKDQALMYLSAGSDLQRWQKQYPNLARKRASVLEKLSVKLQTPQPPEKKVAQYRLYKCGWKNGDVFYFCLDSDRAKQLNLYGRYLLIQKVDEAVWHPGHITPVVHVKLTAGTALPTCEEEYDALEYVKISSTPYEFRFAPIDWSRPKEDAEIKDHHGYLSEYRVELITTSQRVIPSKLTFLGNFRNARPPIDEFIPHTKANLTSIFWKDFETALLDRYWGHNLQNYKIYLSNDEL